MVAYEKNPRRRLPADNHVIRLASGTEINRFDRNYYTRMMKHDHEISADLHEQLGRMFEEDGALQKAFFHYKSAIRKSDHEQAAEIERLVKRLLIRGYVDNSPNYSDEDIRMESYIRIGKWLIAVLIAVNGLLFLINLLSR